MGIASWVEMELSLWWVNLCDDTIRRAWRFRDLRNVHGLSVGFVNSACIESSNGSDCR